LDEILSLNLNNWFDTTSLEFEVQTMLND